MDALQILIPEETLQAKVSELAAQVREEYGEEEIILVGVLKGSLFFLADLARLLGPSVKIDFCQVSSYGEADNSSGVVQIRKDLDINIEGKNVLIVEDIVDTGLTLEHLRELFSTRRPKSLRVVTLLSKPGARKHSLNIEHVGFEIPSRFVVGYGLDFAERYRNLPYIALLNSEEAGKI